MDVLNATLDVLNVLMDAFDVPKDGLGVPLGGLGVPLGGLGVPLGDLGVPLGDLGVPLGVPDVLLDDAKLDDDHIHTHHHLRTCHHQRHGQTLGTHRTANAHNHKGRAYDIAVDGEVEHAPLVALRVHPSLVAQTESLHHNQHHSHRNTHHHLHCSLPALS